MDAGNRFRHWRSIRCGILALVFLAGCSSSSDTTSSFNPGTGGGTHPADWLSTHTGFAVSDVNECTTCHGDDLTGGIADVSCFQNAANCHHGTVAAWVSPAVHGAEAKKAPGSSGFVSCQICHADDFSGGGALVPCLNAACHGGSGASPHPANWLSTDTFVHTGTDQANAPVCFTCHAGGANSPIAPPPAPDPGTPPGCFNSTLCHGASAVPHPVGGTWVTTPPAAQPHGDDAKAVPGATTGFNYCQVCHGTGADFAGGSSGISCYPCHGASAPHPASWRTGDTYVHTTVAEGNASVCAFCHTGGANSPISPPSPPAPGGTPLGCFNSTLCHGAAVTHLIPFLDPDHLGVNQADFDSDCSSCHAVSGSSPVSSAPACQVCHTAGSPLSPTGSFGVCTSCHGYPPDGALGTYPNVAGAHLVHLDLDLLGAGTPVDCDTCHLSLGFVTQAHYDRANGRPGAGGRVPPGDLAFDNVYNAQTGASSFDNAALTCTNVSCHGGQTTPNFQMGTIDVNTNAGCVQCHAFGTSQFNSFNSGEHEKHVIKEGLQCRECHNMDRATPGAQNHFAFLGTTRMEGPASDTFQDSTGNVVYNTTANTCAGSCHGKDHENKRWFDGD